MLMKAFFILAACLSLFPITGWSFDADGPVRETGYDILGGRVRFSFWKDGYWEAEYRIDAFGITLACDNETGLVSYSGDEWIKYAAPGGWTVTFRGSDAVFSKDGHEPVRFKVPNANPCGKIVVDDASGRALVGIQTDSATVLTKLFDLKTGKAVDVDVSPLENRIDSDWPKPQRTDEFIGHWIWQGGMWKAEEKKPGFATGTPYHAGRLGDFQYTLYITFSMDLRQPWPEEGGKAVLTVGKSRLEKEPYADFAGKSPQ